MLCSQQTWIAFVTGEHHEQDRTQYDRPCNAWTRIGVRLLLFVLSEKVKWKGHKENVVPLVASWLEGSNIKLKSLDSNDKLILITAQQMQDVSQIILLHLVWTQDRMETQNVLS